MMYNDICTSTFEPTASAEAENVFGALKTQIMVSLQTSYPFCALLLCSESKETHAAGDATANAG